MQTLKGWQEQLMLSLFKQEANYGEGVTMGDANACQMSAFELETTWPDKILSDKDLLTGLEHGSTQEIMQQGLQLVYKQARATPNALIGLAALVLGDCNSTPDANGTGHKHKIIPVAVGTALPSIQADHKKGGLQYKYRGIKGATLKVSGEEGAFASVEATLMGSGTRDSSSANFAGKITESWLNLTNCKVWMENGANISISANLVQGAEDISNATPDELYPRLKSFEFGWDNGLVEQYGFGSGSKDLQDIDYGRRKATLSFSMLFKDATELQYFLGQEPLAIEFDLKGAIIDANGTMYYGFQLIVPRFKLKAPPLPKGGVNDILTCDFDCEVFEDGTNPAVIIEGYNEQDAYLAA